MSYLALRWTGDSFTPITERTQKALDAEYVVGEIYRFERHEPRSMESHRHYFALIHEAWLNLPERLVDDFPSSEHLRKTALIKAGYCTKRQIVCATKQEAMRTGGFIQELDDYAVVTIEDKVVTVYRAKSQSIPAMGKRDFQESKQAVLDVVAKLIGTDPVTLGRAQAA